MTGNMIYVFEEDAGENAHALNTKTLYNGIIMEHKKKTQPLY